MADMLPLFAPVADPPADPAGLGPILIDARRAAELLGVGLRTLRG